MINPKTDRNMIVVTEAKKCLTLMFNLCKKLHVKKKKKYKEKLKVAISAVFKSKLFF